MANPNVIYTKGGGFFPEASLGMTMPVGYAKVSE